MLSVTPMDKALLPDPLASAPHIAAFDTLANARLDSLELDAVLVYIIDTVSVTALPHLADQFGVSGLRGWRQATTEDQKRSIIKQAIELKRYMGTVYAIEQAMVSLGYGGCTLVEGIDEGTPSIDWAKFKITADLGDSRGLDGDNATNLTALINEYKNVRSHLLSIEFTANISDILDAISEELTENADFGDSDTLDFVPRLHDGTYFRDGSITHSQSNEQLIYSIL